MPSPNERPLDERKRRLRRRPEGEFLSGPPIKGYGNRLPKGQEAVIRKLRAMEKKATPPGD